MYKRNGLARDCEWERLSGAGILLRMWFYCGPPRVSLLGDGRMKRISGSYPTWQNIGIKGFRS